MTCNEMAGAAYPPASAACKSVPHPAAAHLHGRPQTQSGRSSGASAFCRNQKSSVSRVACAEKTLLLFWMAAAPQR